MKITEFKKIGNTNRYKIYVDNEIFGIVLDETIVKNNLNTTTEYDFETLANIINSGQEKLAFDTALNYISKYTKTEKELKEYLTRKGFGTTAIDFAIQKLKNYNYLNDEIYAKNFVYIKKNSKGKKAIIFELKNKGIDEKIANQVCDEIESQNEILEKIAIKFIKNKKQDEKIKEKLFRHLASKGFDFDEIKRTIQNVLNTK